MILVLLTNDNFFLVNQEVAIYLTLIKYAYLQRITETYGKTQSLSFANKVWAKFQCANEFHIQILEGMNTKLYSTG